MKNDMSSEMQDWTNAKLEELIERAQQHVAAKERSLAKAKRQDRVIRLMNDLSICRSHLTELQGELDSRS
jgi:hypothetical protein